MAWHLAELNLELRVAYSIGECADTVGRLVKFGGDVLNFWWRVLLVSRPPTLWLLGSMGLERIVRVIMLSLLGFVLLLLTATVGPLHTLLVRGRLAIGVMA